MARLTRTEYDKACGMWRTGDYKLDDISVEFGVTRSALWRRFKKDGVEKGSDSDLQQQIIKQTIQDEAKKKAEDLANRIIDIRETVVKGCQLMNKRLLHEVAIATKEDIPLGLKLNDFKALHEVSKCLQTNYRTAAEVLGLDDKDIDDDSLPQLVIRNMGEEEIAAMREQQRREAEIIGGKPVTKDEDLSGNDDDLYDDSIEVEE